MNIVQTKPDRIRGIAREAIRIAWGMPDPEKAEAMPGSELQWREWVRRHCAATCTAPFGDRHVRLWDWFEGLQPGTQPRPKVDIWPRGGAKSSTVELCVVRASVKLSRRYCLYVSGTQEQANKHVGSIASTMESIGIERAVSPYGYAKGWKHSELRTKNGFNVTAFGLDAGARGVKLDQLRPDLIVFDDIDQLHDTDATIQKKIETITTTILPTGSSDAATVFVQNRIHRRSIFSQLADNKADFLHNREPVYEEPAVRDLEYDVQANSDGMNRYKIIGGQATWEGQSLEVCERQINEWGLRAFLREAQHQVKAGDEFFFDATKIRIVEHAEAPEGARRVRAWDLAATQGGGDWTIGILMACTGNYPDMRVWILDVRRLQWESSKVRKLILETAVADGPGTAIRMAQDPGQAGKEQAEQYRALLRAYHPVILPVTGDKATRAKGFAEVVNLGNVIMRKQWTNQAYLDVLDNFEESCPPGQSDDDVDASADAFNFLARLERVVTGW